MTTGSILSIQIVCTEKYGGIIKLTVILKPFPLILNRLVGYVTNGCGSRVAIATAHAYSFICTACVSVQHAVCSVCATPSLLFRLPIQYGSMRKWRKGGDEGKKRGGSFAHAQCVSIPPHRSPPFFFLFSAASVPRTHKHTVKKRTKRGEKIIPFF